jgi:RNA polymerase sigma-70 factor (ECF subfamily)
VSDETTERRWQLVLPHRERLVALARRLTGDAGVAEDCAQEAMVRAVAFERLDETDVTGFLVATTARLCADHHRRRTRDGKLAHRLAGTWRDEPAHDDLVCDRAEAAWLTRQLDGLSDRQRAAIEARAAGLSPAEIAESMSTSYKSVELLLYRVRTRLRVTMSGALGTLLLPLRRLHREAGAVTVASAAAVTAAAMLGPVVEPGHRPDRPPPVVVFGPAGPSDLAAQPIAGVAPSPVPAPASWPGPTAVPDPRPTRPSPSPAPSGCPVYEEHVACTSPNPSMTPGNYTLGCVLYGIDQSKGFECKPSPTPSPSGTRRP